MTKSTKWPVSPTKTQISLGIRPVWSESSLSAWRKLGSLATHWAHSEDWSDWVDAHAGLSSLGTQSFCWFCHEATHVIVWVLVGLNNIYLVIEIHVQKYTLSCKTGTDSKRNAYMSPVKRICVFEHSVMTNFNCACPAIQRGQVSGFLSEDSSWLTACMSEQRRFWRDCADA